MISKFSLKYKIPLFKSDAELYIIPKMIRGERLTRGNTGNPADVCYSSDSL